MSQCNNLLRPSHCAGRAVSQCTNTTNKEVSEKVVFRYLGEHGTTQLHPILRDWSVRRVCDHTGQCGGGGSGGVANLWIGDHTINHDHHVTLTQRHKVKT